MCWRERLMWISGQLEWIELDISIKTVSPKSWLCSFHSVWNPGLDELKRKWLPSPNKNSRRYMNETQSSLKHAASCVQESQFTKRRTGFGILKDLTLWHVRREANTILRINYYRLNRTTPLLNIWGQIWIYPDLWTDLSRLYQRISKLPKLNLKAPHSFSLKL